MIELLVKIVINAVALIVAAKIVPNIDLPLPNNFDKPEQWLGIAVLALIFGLVNSYLKPIIKALTLPISVVTMGLISFVINAALLLGLAWIADQLKDTLHQTFTVGGFPPTIGYEAIGAAVVGSIVISIVATVLNIVLAPRRVLL